MSPNISKTGIKNAIPSFYPTANITAYEIDKHKVEHNKIKSKGVERYVEWYRNKHR